MAIGGFSIGVISFGGMSVGLISFGGIANVALPIGFITLSDPLMFWAKLLAWLIPTFGVTVGAVVAGYAWSMTLKAQRPSRS